MEFTKITNDEPVVVPAKDETTYDKLWIKQLVIRSQASGVTQISGTLIPYNGVDTLDRPTQDVFIEDVFGAMEDENRSTEDRTRLAQVMELLLQAVNAELVYKKTLLSEEPII